MSKYLEYTRYANTGATVEPGEYTFVVQTRSGLGDDFGVATATRLVKVVG